MATAAANTTTTYVAIFLATLFGAFFIITAPLRPSLFVGNNTEKVVDKLNYIPGIASLTL